MYRVSDGANETNQGMFHEAMNFASLLDLPAVFVIENNLYGEFTPLARSSYAWKKLYKKRTAVERVNPAYRGRCLFRL